MDERTKIERIKQEMCLRCMECCKQIIIPIPYTQAKEFFITKEFYKARGHEVKYDSVRDIFYIVFDEVCPNLTKDGCKIYYNRPLACVVFDGRDGITTRNKCLWNKLDDRETYKKEN